MLTGLWIRDVVLIESLDLAVGPGLTVLTGETGAGKSKKLAKRQVRKSTKIGLRSSLSLKFIEVIFMPVIKHLF